MAYFPAFIQLEKRNILIIGGGKIAKEKLEKLLHFTKKIDIVAKEFDADLLTLVHKHSLCYKQKSYDEGDIKGYGIVIAAIDDIELQKRIHKETRKYNCLYNAVDVPALCDFIFPSYVKRGELTIAISTSGASPAFAKQLRIYLQKLLPENIDEFLKQMRLLRNTLPKGKERMQLLEEKAKKYIQGWK